MGTLQPAKRLADGRLVAEAHITRAGVFEYADAKYPGGIRRELRPESEVFDQASLDSYASMPITPGHPPKLLTADNAKQYMVGATGERASRDDDHVKSKVMIADSTTIKRMDAGDNEVSCGYTCVIDPTSGVDPKYGRFDVIQRRIRGNHLAVAIPSGRAGPIARVRMDSEITAAERAEVAAAQKKFGVYPTDPKNLYGGDRAANHYVGGAMDPEKLKEANRVLELALTEKTAEVAKLQERADSAEIARDVERGKAATLEGEIGELRAKIAAGATATETEAITRERARADEAERKVARFDEVRNDEVRSRTALMFKAGAVMGPDFRMDDLSKREIEASVVKRLDANADIGSSVPDGIITGRFMSLVDSHLRNARSQARIGQILETTNTETSRTDSKDAKLKAFRDQWKQPLPNDLRARKDV